MKKTILLVANLLTILSATIFAQNTTQEADFYDINSIQEIRLEFEQDNWASVLDSMRLYGNGSMLGKATIAGKKYENVGIRYRGSKSFTTGGKRNAFNIKMNLVDSTQSHTGYKTIKLSNALRDPSMVREVLSYKIARDYMAAPKANYAKLYVNNDYVGLYVNIEAINDDFLETHFGSSENTFIKCMPNTLDPEKPIEGCKNKIYASLEYEPNAQCYTQNYELKSEKGWDDLIGLTKTLNEQPSEIHKVLDVDQTLWMLAFNNVLVNLSSYSGKNSQNYYLYKGNDGKFRPIIWDLNLSFGSLKNTGSGSDLRLSQLQKLDPLLHINNVQKPLISQLLKNEFYKKVYLSHLKTIVADHFVNESYKETATKLQKMITNDFWSDKNKFYKHSDFLNSLNKTIGKRSKIPGIVELMSKRARYLKKHPEVAIFLPEIDQIDVVKREQFSNEKITNFNVQAKVKRGAKRAILHYRFDESQPYEKVFMEDSGKNGDKKAKDNIFTSIVNPKGKSTSMQYYIVVENAKMVNYNPSSYMFEPHMVTLESLNK